MCCALSATLLGLQLHHNHCNVASRQSRDHFGIFFFIITQIYSQALQQLPSSTATQQFNLATPPLLLLVTLKYSNPFYSEQINLAIALPKSTLEIFRVHVLASSEYHSPCPTTTAAVTEPQGSHPHNRLCSYQFPEVKLPFPLHIFSFVLRQWSRGLTQSQTVGKRSSQPLPCPSQCWRESQAATADLVLCRNDSDRIGLHILLLSHLCDGASTRRKPSQQLPCST